MKKLLIFALLAALMISCTRSTRISSLVIPDEQGAVYGQGVVYEPVNLDSVFAKYAGHDGVYLDVERTIEHTGSKDMSFGKFLFGSIVTDWGYYDVKRTRHVVIDPEATWLTHLEFYSKPTKLYVTVTNPDGTVRRYGLEDLKKEKEGDGDIYRIIYPDIRRGSIIEMGREFAHSVSSYLPPLDYDVLLQYRIPCEQLDFTFGYPNWWDIKVKHTGPYSKATHVTRDEPEQKKTVITYSNHDIPAILREPYCPYFKEVCKYMEFRVTELSMEGKKIDRMLAWHDISKAAYERMIKPAKKSQSKIRSLADDITIGCTSDYQRLQRIVNFAQDSIEVIWDTGKPNYGKIIKEKKGSVFGITGLARAMLKELAVPSCYLLVHSAENGYMDDGYVDYGQVTIPAVRTLIDGKYYVAFPYIENLPLDHTPQELQGQTALTVHDDGSGMLWTVPRGNTADNTCDEDYSLTLREDGSITARVVGTQRGFQAYDMRSFLADLTDAERKEAIEDALNDSYGDFDLVSLEIENMEKANEPLVLNLNYEVSNLLTITPEEVIFHTDDLFCPISANEIEFDPDYRQLPISIPYDQRYNKNVEINFPPTWEITTELAEVSLENMFGSISGQYTIEDGKLVVNQQAVLNRASEPKEKYHGLLQLLGDQSLLRIPSIVFSTADSTQPEPITDGEN